MTKIDQHKSRAELAIWLAGHIADLLQFAIDQNGAASLAVSGGSTPNLLFAELAKQKIDWDKVTITLVDERWVPEDNERSNAKLIKEHLLVGFAKVANFLPLFDAEIAASEIGNNAKQFETLLPFDVVILGMGNDGHTASFFTGGNNLDKATDPKTNQILIDINAQGAGEPRVTFTLPALISAREIILHIEGETKKQVLLEAQKDGELNALPIRHVLKARKDIKVVWA